MSTPFSLRTTSVVAVFACIFIASPQGASLLTTNVATISALALYYGQLTNVYPLLLHQDTANNRSDLYAAIASAEATVQLLNGVVAGMIAAGDNGFVLRSMQIVTANALASLKNVQNNENDGEE